MSYLILLTFIHESVWANILSSLSSFVPHFKYIVFICCQLHIYVLSKHIADATASCICEYSQCLSFLLLTRQWYCSREVVTLLFLGCYQSGSKPLTEKNYIGFHFLVSFVTSFSSGYILCDYVFIIFFWLYYWGFFLQWQFLFNINFNQIWVWEQITTIWRTVLFFSWYTSYKSEVHCIVQNDSKLYTVFILGRLQNLHVIFSELVLDRFYECIFPINFGIHS